MRRFLITSLLLCFAVPSLFAQGGFTTVTGTITDPNGLKYACGTISAQLITAGGAGATLNGGGFTTQTSPIGLGCPTSPGTGAPGSFAMRLADSGVINPSNTTWRFTINMTPGIAPPAGTGPQSFTVTTAINCGTNTPSTCTSNQMDISTLLSAAAPALSNGSISVPQISTQVQSTPCASSMTFTLNATFTTDFFLLLNCNVTSSTVAGTPVQGQEAVFTIVQGSPGGQTFAFPANFLNTPVLATAAGGTTAATFQYCGAAGLGSSCPAGQWQNTDVGPAGVPLPNTSFNSYIDPIAQFGILATAKWVTDAVYNTAQTTCGAGSGLPAGRCVTISATDPPFVCPGGTYPCTSGGEVGFQEFGTAGCPAANPGACTKAVPKGTIVEIWDATHAQVSASAVVNSSGSMNNFSWGPAGNSAKITTMDAYLVNNPGTAAVFPCGSANPSSGVTGGAGAIWLDANNAGNFGFGNHNYPVGIIGCENGGTVFISCPDPGPTGLLIDAGFTIGNLPYPGGVGTGDQFQDLFFWGLGNDTGTNEGHNLVSIAGPAIVKNVYVQGYAYNVVNTFVINGINCQGCTLINSGSYVGGNFPCQLTGSPNQFFATKMIGGVCGGSNSAGMTLSGSTSVDGGGMISIDSAYLYGTLSNPYGVVNSSTVPVTITSSYIGGIQQTGTGQLNLIGNNIDRFLSNAPFAINNAGGTINLQGNTINGQGNAWLSQSSGTTNDLGGNAITNLPTATLTGGTYSGSTSVATALQVNGNFAVGSNSTAIHGQVTVTYAGTLATPATWTMTFPKAFNVVPYCSVVDMGGTNPFPTQIDTTATPVTTTTLTVKLTFAAAPVATQTDIFVWDCHN
jgi:hypothetical protein